MKLFAVGAALAISAAAVGAASGPQAAVPAASDKDVTIIGCVVKGDGGYVLMPVPEQGGSAAILPPAATTGSGSGAGVSATGAGPEMLHVLYWLDDDDKVDDHAGQRVEVSGKLDDDLDRGEVKVERQDDGLTKVEFKRKGKEITVKLPNVPGFVGTSGTSDHEQKFEYAVREVNVKKVKMLASTCQ